MKWNQQLEAKEAAWGAELSTRLEAERAEFDRRLAERETEAEAARTEERRTWQAQMDGLLKKANHLLADKERLEKNIRQQVDARVQVNQISFSFSFQHSRSVISRFSLEIPPITRTFTHTKRKVSFLFFLNILCGGKRLGVYK